MKTMRAIADKVSNEGLGYFLITYASPRHIPDDADPKALEFKRIWKRILP